ncbi:MAG: hypothetical protein ACFE96_02130 [Candidatus Hermodarchaeota archaeon]
MPQQFKVLTYIQPLKDAKKDFQPYEFEKLVNEQLQNGWKVVNCVSTYMGGVSPVTGTHYWAFLVKD